ncbi:hypothetical protein [Pacificibacter sp. AS14]|uniref:hypothetical protein n=1 Tax=Pacificibacter sp. AS14 TaxID=3135785 RepID=UPI003182AE80
MRKIAIIGAGPSGCFTAQGLLKLRPDWQVDVYDKLPVPYGLVRYGVAADHQGTKNIVRQFERVFTRQGARFFGNVTLGQDVTLDQLRDAYDGVVLAAGLAGDRSLNFDTADGVIGAGELTRALYDHPDAPDLPDIGGDVVILGNGNVAVDILRLLAKGETEFNGSDLSPRATQWLTSRDITSLTIIGRSAAQFAKFDPVMIRELGKLEDVSIRVDDPLSGGEKGLEALRSIDGLNTGSKRITFSFGRQPKGIETQDGKITGLSVETEQGSETISCDALITAIGFCSDASVDRDALIESAEAIDDGHLAAGLYAAGWFRRGPRGTIAENRTDSLALAARIVEDIEQNLDCEKMGQDVLGLSAANMVTYQGWQRINEHETTQAMAARCRTKIHTRAEMLHQASTIKEVN